MLIKNRCGGKNIYTTSNFVRNIHTLLVTLGKKDAMEGDMSGSKTEETRCAVLCTVMSKRIYIIVLK